MSKHSNYKKNPKKYIMHFNRRKKSHLIKKFTDTYKNDENAIVDAINTTKKYFDEIKLPSKKIYKYLTVCFEEIFLNIAYYAFENDGEITITYEFYNDHCRIVFCDAGKRFNPLLKKAAKIAASEREKKVGGFGIMMVKKLMDSVSYAYSDNRNFLTIKKYY